MEKENRIILSEDEYNGFMRWAFGQLHLQDFTQYKRDGWTITAVRVNTQFTELYSQKGGIYAVCRELYDKYIRSAWGKPRARPIQARYRSLLGAA